MTAARPATRRHTPVLRRLAYRTFYLLPKSVRRRLVRLATPTYTVGAVMLLYNLDHTRLLMLRQPPGHGWGLPAGLLERGERPARAAVRELAEETGIDLDVSDIEPAVPNCVVHTYGRWVDLVFTGRVDPDKVTVTVDGAEVLDAQWWPVDALPPVTVAASRLMAHYRLGPYADYPESARID